MVMQSAMAAPNPSVFLDAVVSNQLLELLPVNVRTRRANGLPRQDAITRPPEVLEKPVLVHRLDHVDPGKLDNHPGALQRSNDLGGFLLFLDRRHAKCQHRLLLALLEYTTLGSSLRLPLRWRLLKV